MVLDPPLLPLSALLAAVLPSPLVLPEVAVPLALIEVRPGQGLPLPSGASVLVAGLPPVLRLLPMKEIGGPAGPEPTRYGDWERKGRVSDF